MSPSSCSSAGQVGDVVPIAVRLAVRVSVMWVDDAHDLLARSNNLRACLFTEQFRAHFDDSRSAG
jgi:hypothetical protein